MELLPYENENVVLYMDDLTGPNIVLKAIRTHGVGKSHGPRMAAGGTTVVPRGGGGAGPAALADGETVNPRRNIDGTRGPETDNVLRHKRYDESGNDPEGRRFDGETPSSTQYPRRRFLFDVNLYQQKKTLAQGMMDLALLSANANQFRYVLQSSSHPYFMVSLSMIGTSLFLQVMVGIGLIWNSTYNVKKDTHTLAADKINNFTIIGIFLVTILNVFITSFGVAEPYIGSLKDHDAPRYAPGSKNN